MFDIDGGLINVLIAGMNMIAIAFLVILPISFSMSAAEKFGVKQVVIGAIGLVVYCFLLYVANPGLAFWAVK